LLKRLVEVSFDVAMLYYDRSNGYAKALKEKEDDSSVESAFEILLGEVGDEGGLASIKREAMEWLARMKAKYVVGQLLDNEDSTSLERDAWRWYEALCALASRWEAEQKGAFGNFIEP
jgi:hypothetical protein